MAAVCPPNSSITLVGSEPTLYVTVTVAKSSWDSESALSCTGADTLVMVPPYIVICRSPSSTSWLLVLSVHGPETSDLTSVVSEVMSSVSGEPGTQSLPVSPWHRSAVDCVRSQVARES